MSHLKLGSELRRKHVPPSLKETAFNCPHCGTLTSQTWYQTYAREPKGVTKLLFFPDMDVINSILNDNELDDEAKEHHVAFITKIHNGLIFFQGKEDAYTPLQAVNLHLSRCFNCGEISVWVYDRLLFPPELNGEEPNEDLSSDVLVDYQEAHSILNLSPRGACALLRLAIQKLCIYLGESGKDINADIASLVKKGLSPIVQKSLDVVRVIGNEAVHPGTLDLRDDRDTASKLFRLVNIIAERMISHPKHVDAMYDELPESKKAQIEKRDA
jgi:hypothetical protein